MRLSDALTWCLLQLRVTHVFGVSGANIEHFHDAIHRLGNGQLRSVLTRSESGAAFMADGFARVHRRLGVCCSTSGGGMLNLLVGIAEARQESVPVLAIIGQPPTTQEGKGGFQDSSGTGHTVDAVQLCRAAAKFVAKLTSPAEFWTTMSSAVREALGNRPGPSVLLVPRNAFDLDVGEPPPDWLASLERSLAPRAVSEDDARPLFEAIRQARCPVLLVGHGVGRSHLADAVAQFGRAANIPAVTTMGGRAFFPHRAPSYVGLVGAAGQPSAHQFIEKEADLVVAVGTGLGVMSRGPLEQRLASVPLYFVNIDASEQRPNYPQARFLEADAGEAFTTLHRMWKAEPFTVPARAIERRVFYPLLRDPAGSTPAKPLPLRQSRALAMLDRVLPEDGHLLFDAGNCCAAALHYGRVPARTSSTVALGMGGMGYAVAASIGVQLGGGSRTVAVIGDGALLMNGFEIHTAVALKLPILFVIFNNGGHGMCVTRQDVFFEGRHECVTYPALEVATLARGLGSAEQLWVGRTETEGELERALEDHQRHAHLPGVLELVLRAEEMPPFAPFLPKNAPTLTQRELLGLEWDPSL